MTTYREINNTEVAVDAPLTQQLMQALKDNVIAIAEGDDTASTVRITPKALTDTISQGDFTLLRIVGHQNTQDSGSGTDTHRTIKFRARMNGQIKIQGRVKYTDIGSQDTMTFKIIKETSAGSTSNEVTVTDSGGDTTHTISTNVSFNADDMLYIQITTQDDADVKFHVTFGCSDKEILGQAVFYSTADDEITDTLWNFNSSQLGSSQEFMIYQYSFI
jgi:hypothetical protein